MRWVEEWTKSQALGCPCITPRNIQEVQASMLGDAPEAPLLHRQKSGHLSKHYIFIASCAMCFSWSVSCFSFLSWFVLFFAINGWTPTNFLCRRCTHFHLQKNALVFTLIKNRVCFFFCYYFWFSFLPWFAFRPCHIFSSRCIFSSDLYWYSSKEVFIKISNGVGKEKKLYAK
jgi:hypothetical protein